MDKDQYDRPEDKSSLASRSMLFVLLAIGIVVSYWFFFNR